jgi:hypothetical protein
VAQHQRLDLMALSNAPAFLPKLTLYSLPVSRRTLGSFSHRRSCPVIWLGAFGLAEAHRPNFPFPKREITGRFRGQTEYFGLKIRTKLHFVQYLLGFLAFFDRLKITGCDFRKTGKRRPKTGKRHPLVGFFRHVRETLARFICFASLGYRLGH